uniref:Uncharacterized protein n=1 Tax=Octopus bimaculoides TaxID=37653 RepID=A0A0L8GG92_OCTBM
MCVRVGCFLSLSYLYENVCCMIPCGCITFFFKYVYMCVYDLSPILKKYVYTHTLMSECVCV